MSDFQLDTNLTKLPPSVTRVELDERFGSIDMAGPPGRFINISVDRPRSFKGDDGTQQPEQYSIRQIFAVQNDQGQSYLADLHKAICLVADHKWPNGITIGNPQTGQNQVVKASECFGSHLRYPLRNGDEQYMRDPEKNGIFRGVWFLGAKMMPTDQNGQPVDPPYCVDPNGQPYQPHEIAALFKPGCYGRASLRVYAYDHPKGGKGVSFILQGVQFWMAGTLPGGRGSMSTRVGQQFADAGSFPVASTNGPVAVPGWDAPVPGQPVAPQPVQQPQAQPNWQPPPAGGGNFVPPNQAPQGYPRPGVRPPGV